MHLIELTWNHVGCWIGGGQPIGRTDRWIGDIGGTLSAQQWMISARRGSCWDGLGFQSTFHDWHFINFNFRFIPDGDEHKLMIPRNNTTIDYFSLILVDLIWYILCGELTQIHREKIREVLTRRHSTQKHHTHEIFMYTALEYNMKTGIFVLKHLSKPWGGGENTEIGVAVVWFWTEK